jgi:3-dehydroquinate synthase
MAMKNLILTGFMGTGKSRIGRLLAANLNMPFIDMDRTIEQRQGKTVSEIFSDYGELFFRELEKQLCFELSKKSGQIIATGGGALVPRANRQLFAKDSVFCLQAPFEVLAERLSRNTKRPLAANAKEIFLERKPYYENFFHQIDSWKDPPEQIAARIQRLFELDAQFEPLVQDLYPIVIEPGVLDQLPDFLNWLSVSSGKIAVISNPEIAKLYASKIQGYELILIPEGESHKNLETVQQIYTQLLEKDFTRHDVLIALGGGVVGDITGFVAATYMRGMAYVQVPTSLLAMVDSSVGGKTGVDLPEGKNLVGAFKNPKGVLIDPEFLKTLPEAEIKCGLAEIVKHAIIADPELFEILESGQFDFEFVIRRALQVKIKIVHEDPKEENQRMLLNLGHTFGHAIELLSNYQIRHGEAVAIGMVQAAQFALEQKFCKADLVERIRNLLIKLGLPTELPNISKDALWTAMKHDKKRKADKLSLVLPYGLGDVRIFRKSFG